MSRLSRAGGSRKVPVLYTDEKEHSPTLDAAVRAHRKGLVTDALHGYQQRLEQEPACLDAWMNLGALQVRAGLAREATEAFQQAALLAPENGRVFRDIGVGLCSIGQLEAAESALTRSVALAPELVGSWLHLARTRLEVATPLSAVAAARAAVELRPEDPSAWFLLARCLFDDGAPAPSLEALARARACAQPYPEAELFQLLLSSRPPWPGRGRTQLSIVRALSELSAAQPRLDALADAAAYLVSEVSGARWLSSARETLRFAASIAKAEGAVLELGVFHGLSLRWLTECRPGAVHGFDGFWGLPGRWAHVPEGRFTTAGRPPEDIDAQLWVGPFEEQLPRYVTHHQAAQRHCPIALLHIDSDLYESARCGLHHLGPLLRVGSVIVFDEYLGHRNWRQDEYRAFQEAVTDNGWHYEYRAANPFTGQVVVRLCDRP